MIEFPIYLRGDNGLKNRPDHVQGMWTSHELNASPSCETAILVTIVIIVIVTEN